MAEEISSEVAIGAATEDDNTKEDQGSDAATVAAGKAVATDLLIDSKDGNTYHVVRNELS